jgi:Zn finger protein HypA/HybF involved in hydrogenase expression
MSIECLECGHVGQPESLNFPESMYGFVEVCTKCKSTNYNVIIDEPSPAEIQAIKAQQERFLQIMRN